MFLIYIYFLIAIKQIAKIQTQNTRNNQNKFTKNTEYDLGVSRTAGKGILNKNFPNNS